jgi:triphosphoribosyl-dephospho-CoA synthase
MDFFTFMSSSSALIYFFSDCAEMGLKYAGRNPEELFQALRGIGKKAERDMLEVTGGVNTHKGLIFSMGIICAAASCSVKENEAANIDIDAICTKVSLMTRGLCLQELASLKASDGLTHGEKLYIKYGVKGIRGEVEGGFPTVRKYALPILKELKARNRYGINDILIQTLLHLMAANEDTNIAARHDMEVLEDVKKHAKAILDAGGMLSSQGVQMIYDMDKDFIARNISPGGSADLLAVTIMLNLLSECNISKI